MTPRTAASRTAPQLSITNSRSLLKLMSIEAVMPSNHLILCGPLLLLPSIFPSIRDFSSESVLCIRWPNYWNINMCYQFPRARYRVIRVITLIKLKVSEVVLNIPVTGKHRSCIHTHIYAHTHTHIYTYIYINSKQIY